MFIKQIPGGSSTTKTGRHDIAEILLKMALKHQKINQSIKHDELIVLISIKYDELIVLMSIKYDELIVLMSKT
jgi:hypothetical protein